MLVLCKGLQDISLPCEISVGVLQALKQTLLQHQDGDSELVPQQLHRPESHTHLLLVLSGKSDNN